VRGVARGTPDGSLCPDYWTKTHEYHVCNEQPCPVKQSVLESHMTAFAIVASIVGVVIFVGVIVVLFVYCRITNPLKKILQQQALPPLTVPEKMSEGSDQGEGDFKEIELK